MHLACREAVELVTDYLEDALDTAGLRAFADHVEDCRGCEELLRQMRWTIALLGALESMPKRVGGAPLRAPPAASELVSCQEDGARRVSRSVAVDLL